MLNFEYLSALFASYFCEFWYSVDAVFVKIPNVPEFGILENKSETEYKTNKPKKNFWYFWLQKYGRKRNTGFFIRQNDGNKIVSYFQWQKEESKQKKGPFEGP